MSAGQMAFDFTAPLARLKDSSTSHEAAQRAATGASRGRALVLKTLASIGPCTDFDLARLTGWQQTSIGKRRGECVDAGLVRNLLLRDGAKATRPSPSGSSALVWELTEAGQARARELEAQA